MLQRLSEVAYNSYWAYLRRRRDPVRELFAERAETYRQPVEIDRLRARINEHDVIIDAEDQ